MGEGVAGRIAAVRERIDEACARVGRDPADVTLVAVSKTFPASVIRDAVAAGVQDIGENRVRELVAKRDELEDAGIRWHLVGPLQRNKVKHVAGAVSLIHSIESERIGLAVAARALASGTRQDVLLQVNVAREAGKHGVAPAGAPALAEQLAAVDGLRLTGFMTIPPAGDPEAARSAFSALRALRDRLGIDGATHLSMGMTADLSVAVEEGATIVRVGTAIFGSREGR